jgi:hypothetical protein
MCGLEIEIRRRGEEHVYVRRRDGVGHPQYAAVFGSLRDGSYEFRVRGRPSPTARAVVSIRDGSVVHADWA